MYNLSSLFPFVVIVIGLYLMTCLMSFMTKVHIQYTTKDSKDTRERTFLPLYKLKLVTELKSGRLLSEWQFLPSHYWFHWWDWEGGGGQKDFILWVFHENSSPNFTNKQKTKQNKNKTKYMLAISPHVQRTFREILWRFLGHYFS